MHISKYVMKGVKKDLNIIRMLTGTDYGLDKKSLLVIYKSLIRSKIDYGA